MVVVVVVMVTGWAGWLVVVFFETSFRHSFFQLVSCSFRTGRLHFIAMNHAVLKRFRPAETTIALLERQGRFGFAVRIHSNPGTLLLLLAVNFPSLMELVNIQNPPEIMI